MIIIYLYKNNAMEAQETTTDSKCKKNKSFIPHPTACDSETMICKAPTGQLESCFERPTENTENGDLGSMLYLLRTK